MDLASAPWRKSSHSGEEGHECVELAGLTGAVGVRDSTNPGGPALVISRPALGALLRRVKSGDLDV
jgi:hypothetical protein